MHKRTENIKVQAKKTLDRNQIQKSMAQKLIFSENVYQKIREIDLFSCDEFLGLYLCSKYICIYYVKYDLKLHLLCDCT